MLRSLMNKRLLWAGFLVVLLAFTLAACDADTGDDATLDEPGVVQEPLGADEGVVGQDDDILGDDEDIVGQDDDVVGDDDVLTDGTDDIFTDDRIGVDEPGITYDENDAFEATGRIETINEDEGFFDLGFDDEPNEQIYLREGDTFDNYDFQEGDVVNLRGARENGQIYVDEIELGDATMFDDAGATNGLDDQDTDNPLVTDDNGDMDDDDDMDDDADELGIQWDGDEFSLTGTIVGQPDLINNMLTVEANGEQYTIYIADTVVYEDNLFAEDLMDGDLVEIEGVRDDTGDMWAHSIELEDGDGPFGN